MENLSQKISIKISEEWKTHPILTNYQISSFGKVKSLKYNKIMNQYTDKDGYKYIYLRYMNKGYRKQVHRLVAETFISNPDNLPIVCHKTKRKDSNKVKDLFWCSSRRAVLNAYDRGFYPSIRGHRKTRNIVDDKTIVNCMELFNMGFSNVKISRLLDLSITSVWKIRNGKHKLNINETIQISK